MLLPLPTDSKSLLAHREQDFTFVFTIFFNLFPLHRVPTKFVSQVGSCYKKDMVYGRHHQLIPTHHKHLVDFPALSAKGKRYNIITIRWGSETSECMQTSRFPDTGFKQSGPAPFLHIIPMG